MGPTNSLSYLINHLSDVIAKQSDQVLQEQLGIGYSQYKILLVLEWSPRIQQKRIADNLGQTEASISRQIKLLKAKGLVTYKIDPNNLRRHITVTTPLGMQLTEVAVNLLRRTFASDFNSIGEDNLVKVIAGLQELHKTVCKPGKAGACDHQLGI